MESIIFIIAWIITGIIANVMVFNMIRNMVIDSAAQNGVEVTKKEAETTVLDFMEPEFTEEELSKPETKVSILILALLKWIAIAAVGIAVWPVCVSIALYVINLGRKEN